MLLLAWRPSSTFMKSHLNYKPGDKEKPEGEADGWWQLRRLIMVTSRLQPKHPMGPGCFQRHWVFTAATEPAMNVWTFGTLKKKWILPNHYMLMHRSTQQRACMGRINRSTTAAHDGQSIRMGKSYWGIFTCPPLARFLLICPQQPFMHSFLLALDRANPSLREQLW